MLKGIYISLSGAVLKQTQLEVVSQNLANADTIGYKKDNLSFRDYLIPNDQSSPGPDGRVMSSISSFRTDFSDGNTFKTGNPLDIAIEGNGFIALEGNRYTRRGDMKIDNEGYLTSYNAIRILGNNGPINLSEGTIEISETGSISVDGTEIDSIKIMDFGLKENLRKLGGGLFSSDENGTRSTAGVKQGYLEKSNVDVIKEIVHMIETLREFEAYKKAIQTFDDASDKVINQMGRL